MPRNQRFPKVKLGELASLLGEFKTTLIKANVAAAEARRQEEEEAKRRAASQPPKHPLPAGPKPKLKQEYLNRLSRPLPDEGDGASKPKQNPERTPPLPKLKTAPRQQLSQQPVTANPAKNRAAAADQVRALVSASTPSIEERPKAISKSSKRLIDQAMAAGAAILRDRPEPDEDGYIIGFDFGTSSLKVAYRQPYVAGDPVAVIPVPEVLRSAGHPGLWQSVIWYNPADGSFSLYPVSGSVALDGFKTGLIAGNGGKPMPQAAQVTRAEAATAFLALQFAYMIGAYSIEQPLHPVGGDHFLSINIGIPVAVRDDKRAFDEFSRIVSAAYTLAPDAGSLRLGAIQQKLTGGPTTLPEFLQLVPELTAAVAGYAADPMVQLGAHILVDVGASTLDLVAFNLQEGRKAAVFTAGVDLFGSGALQVAREAGIHDDVFTQACFHLFHEVYGKAKADHRAPSLFKPGRRRLPVQLVITGGGCDTTVHNHYINLLPRDQVLGALTLKRPSPPARILKEEADQSRLLLAYGLTRDVTELHQLRLPTEIEDLQPPPAAPLSPSDKDF